MLRRPLCTHPPQGITEKESEDLRGMFVNTNPYLLYTTIAVSCLHLLFDMLAFKNDLSCARGAPSLQPSLASATRRCCRGRAPLASEMLLFASTLLLGRAVAAAALNNLGFLRASAGDAAGAREVARVDGGGEAVARVVGEADGGGAGNGEEDDSWEDEANINEAALRDFEDRQARARRA